MNVADTAFGSCLKVGDTLACLGNTYWTHQSGNTPPNLVVSKLMVTQVRAKQPDGQTHVLSFPRAKRDVLADSPNQITYAFKDGKGDKWQTTWMKMETV